MMVSELEKNYTDKLSDKVKESVNDKVHFIRMGEVNDITKTAVFLATDKSSYIIVQTIAV